MPDDKTLRLILGDQLNYKHSWFRGIDEAVTYVFMEVRQETDYVMHHIQKVTAFFAAMRAFADHLREKGHAVIYLTLDDKSNRQDLADNMLHLVKEQGFTRFEYLLPDEYRLDRQLAELVERLEIPAGACDTEHFLTERYEVRDFFAGKKQYLMESFYRHMRRKHEVLMAGDQPVGGQWNFDKENRDRYDGEIPLMNPRTFENDVSDIVEVIKKAGVKTFGRIDPQKLIWPIDRSQARSVVRRFLKDGLPYFGRFQDAMTTESWALFHSRISFALNTKMLHPKEIIEDVVAAYEDRPDEISLAQVEGFVRQILGWREYMRGIYWASMPDYAEMNFFGFTRRLPDWYWNGETKMSCCRHAVGQSLDYAYAHHIQRLMVTGNFSLLAGIDPDEVDRWYLGVYIDAIEWVEITNTRGMSQYADGGIVGSKPYVSSANYIHKMSDYCQSCHYDRKRKYGDNACPFNSLYWAFFERNRSKLEKNARLGMMYRTWDKMHSSEKEKILAQATRYLDSLDNL